MPDDAALSIPTPPAARRDAPAAAKSASPAYPVTGLRLWFILYLAWMIGLTILARTMFDRYSEHETALFNPRSIWLLAFGCFYLTLCNVFLPLPTSILILVLAAPGIGLEGNPLARIAVIGLCCGFATMMANLNEYHILGYFFRARLGSRIRHSRAYRWSVRWFDVSPFRVLVLVAFVPIPVDVVRWIAILRGYPRARFAAAYYLGRSARYAMLAAVAVVLSLTTWQIVLIQIGLVLLLAARLLWAIILGKPKPGPAENAAR